MRPRGIRLLAVALCVGGTMTAFTSAAQADTSCHNINASGVGQDHGGGSTTATISNGGLLEGTTQANFAASGSPPTLALSGTVKFLTNNDGATLTVSVTGTFNLSNGQFAASGPVSASTGKLAGATGSLAFEGVENLNNGTFTETITGNVCADLNG